MKKVVILGERQGGIVEVQDPKSKENWAKVKIFSAPMCTEYHAFLSGRKVYSLGHEAAGEIVEIAWPGKVKVGDRVVVMPQYPCGTCGLCVNGEYIHCQNNIDFKTFIGSEEGSSTMAQYVLKPDWLLPVIPEGISYPHASLACCGLGPTFGAMERMGVDAFDTVLITGLGPVGLGGIVNAKYRGAKIIGMESHPWRMSRALELGADFVINPQDKNALEQVLDLTDGYGVDNAVDCSGQVVAHRMCIDATKRRGNVGFVGQCREKTSIRISSDMIQKGLTLVGCWHYSLKEFSLLMQVITESGPVLDKLISHIFPLDQVQQAWELQVTGECAKVILSPWEGEV